MTERIDDTYTIPMTTGEAEVRVLGSRFLATAAPVTSFAEADAIITATRKQFHDSTHVVSAIVIGHGSDRRERYSDDGEPSGTGGRPILSEIERADLVHVLVTVTRWFGGKKLGTGRLARAYAQAAEEALAQCRRAIKRPMARFQLQFSYKLEKMVMRTLDEVNGLVAASEFSGQVVLSVRVPRSSVQCFQDLVTERSAGQIYCELIEE